MIGVKIEGRLGNQLFQYAFIYNTAKKLKTRFYVDKGVNDFMLTKYFNIKTDYLYPTDRVIKIFRKIFGANLGRNFYRLIKKALHLKEITIDNNPIPAIELKKLEDNAFYNGYFQSEDYFVDSKNDIINLFSVKKRYQRQFEKVFKSLPPAQTYVTVHARRGDFVDLDYSVAADYYHKAIESIHSEENYYIFISDDFEFINREFDYLDKKYLSKNREIIDFQFLINADICVLSNSTFGWWGAYLNPKKPVTVASKYWLGRAQKKEYPTNVVPPHWQQID